MSGRFASSSSWAAAAWRQSARPNQPLPDLAPLDAQFAHAAELISQNNPDQAGVGFRQVAQDAEQMLKSNPDLAQELRGRLHSLAGQSWLAVDQPGRAQAHFQALIDMAPRTAEPLVGLAAAHVLQDRLDAASEALDRAIRLNPDLSSAHLLKACVLNKQSERVLALREFRLGGGAEALIKMPLWMRPVLDYMECTPAQFT